MSNSGLKNATSDFVNATDFNDTWSASPFVSVSVAGTAVEKSRLNAMGPNEICFNLSEVLYAVTVEPISS